MAKASANTPLTMPATDAQVEPEPHHEAQAVASLTDHSQPDLHDFVVGKLVQEKHALGRAFKITSIDTTGVRMQMVGSYTEDVFPLYVHAQTLIAEFKLLNKPIPQKSLQ